MRRLPLFFVLLIAAAVTPAEGQFWNPFRSKEKPAPAAKAALAGEPAPLSEKSGPWLILATTFSGEGAEEQANELSAELRQTLGLPTYVHQMTFEFGGDEPVGRGVDRYGAPVKMRFRAGEKRKEWAVLLGEYPAIDDPMAERDLATVKTVRPASLEIDPELGTHQNLASYRSGQLAAQAEAGEATTEGPMRTAFLTRNPLLPDEFFVPKGVDKFVAKMNKGLEHSALDIKGKYSVKVATFRGRGTLVGASQARSSSSRRKKDRVDPLVEAAENAHLLCLEMRKKGWEAYEFHNRTESYVTVGSFDSVTSAGGRPSEEVVEIVRTFGAAFDTSPTPLQKKRGPTNEARAEQVKQTFNQLFTSEVGQVAAGMNPKYAQVAVAKGQPLRPIPFDVHPHVIEAPKRSVSSSFAWRR